MKVGEIVHHPRNPLPHLKVEHGKTHNLREHGGASVLTGSNTERIRKEYKETLRLKRKPERPEKWDGNTAGRCLRAILENMLHADPSVAGQVSLIRQLPDKFYAD